MEDPLDIYQDVIDISSDDEVTEADNYPQKEEMTDREWRDELDDIRAEIQHESHIEDDEEEEDEIIMSLPAVEGLKEDILDELREIKEKGMDYYMERGGDLDFYQLLERGNGLSSINTALSELDAEGKIRGYDKDNPTSSVITINESKAYEDFGQFTVPKNPDLVTSQYPTDQEGFGRASLDDATIEDRKNWLSVNGFDIDEAWSPYYSLDSYIRANLAKDLHVGGINAMGTGSLY